ncbi:hypothetical protein [Bacillus sp. V59.32b]|uniref:hypothetical protein n=1 Tax=Bacillus sp. V59.32b TaxID=1758642 RepID=UPI000E3EC371|nr:hypothetical protein [Bacillus sp. V59.32b]RFU64613.1 hypothetical protein D0463_09970 [Bacillus sp. V59.32b]
MILYLYVMLGINILIPSILYLIMRKRRKLYTDRYGMIVTSAASLVFSLSIGTTLFFAFPASFNILIVISTVSGSLIGLTYGTLIKFHSMMIGSFNGMIGALAGTMLAAVVLDPSLCGLPSAFTTMLDRNMMLITLLVTLLSFITSILIRFSYRV